MSDPVPGNPPVPPPQGQTPPAAGGTNRRGTEFDSPKNNLPPIKILLLATAGILLIAGVASFFQRAKPQGSGSLDHVAAVDLPNQNSVLAAMTFTLRNSGEKAMWIHSMTGKMVGEGGEASGDTVSAVDLDRYYQAFPALKAETQPALAPEDKIAPGQEVKRTVMVSFPVNLDAFNKRKSLSVVLQPYDQPLPVVLTK